MVSKTPEKWLEKNSSARLVEPEQTPTGMIVSPNNNNDPNTLVIGAQQAINALMVFRAAGLSIDEALDKNQIRTPSLPKDPDDE